MGRTLVARMCVLLAAFFLLIAGYSPVSADYVLELPILAAVKSNGLGVFEVLMLHWDQRADPIPPTLQWRVGNVVLGTAHVSSMAMAFRYAMEHTPAVRHAGTVTAVGLAYVPTGSDGPSAGAAMAVGFIALFKGDHIHRGIALTGTLRPNGAVGPVGSIPDKVRAAAREGYRTILIPSGQLHDPEWNLVRLGMELNVDLKEVATIEEAYQLMTGHPL
jgi:Lon-like protease